MRILITDAHTRAALAAVRSLYPLGAVHVSESRQRSVASASRHVSAAHRVPDPGADVAGFVAAIRALVESQAIDVVLPVTDAASAALLPVRETLRPCLVAGPSSSGFSRLSDKSRVAQVAAQLGLEVPAGGVARDLTGARRIARELGFPVILKPIASVVLDAQGRMRRTGVERVEREQDLEGAWLRCARDQPALVQRIVPGWGEGVFLLRWAGVTHAVFAHRRLREKPPEGGVATLCESTAVDSLELARIERLLDEAQFDGVAMAEFRTDGKHRWLIEVNARLWGSLQLALDAGVDFPRLLVEVALGRPIVPVRSYRVGIRSRWLLGDLDHALLLAAGRTSTSGASGPGAALCAALSGGPGCRLEGPRWDDPGPFAAELCQWLRALGRRTARA